MVIPVPWCVWLPSIWNRNGQVRNVFETQTLSLARLKVRRIEVTGTLQDGVTAKDVALKIIAQLGVKGGIGYAYEYAGPVFDAMSMEERMTVCNMSIEEGYVNPDQNHLITLKVDITRPKETHLIVRLSIGVQSHQMQMHNTMMW